MQAKMEKSVEVLSHSLIGIRGGTINPGVVDTVKVDYYGQKVPILQVAQTGRMDNNNIAVDPYEPSMVGSLVTALKANGFSAYQFSKTRVLISVPPVSGEEKEKVRKYLRKLGEDAKIAIRNIRKKYRKEGDLDEKKVQEVTDQCIKEIDDIVKLKADRL